MYIAHIKKELIWNTEIQIVQAVITVSKKRVLRTNVHLRGTR